MRLFTKTLLSFAAVILFESILTSLFVTNTIQAANRNDARYELESEAKSTYDGFNSWKRRIWKDLIALSNDENVSAAAALDNQSERAARISRYLRRSFHRTGYDLVFVSIRPEGYTDIAPISYNTFSLSELQSLRSNREQPYVEVGTIGHVMAIIGVLRLPAGAAAELDIFIIKRIDRQFCESLATSRSAFCTFYIDGTLADGGETTLSSTAMPVRLSPANAYVEAFRLPTGSGVYNVAAQRIPNLSPDLDGRNVVMVTFLSNLPYENRLKSVREIVIVVSAATATLMLLLSLVLTSTITVPVRRLLRAMRRFQNGEYVTAVPGSSSVEIAQLLSGFNEMASKLQRDRLAMNNYVKEITFLNEYNERVIESIGSGIVVLDEAGRVQKANSAFSATVASSPEQVLGRPVEQLDPELFGGKVSESIRAVQAGRAGALDSIRRTRGRRVFEIKLYPLHADPRSGRLSCILVVDDISRKSELEEKIFQAEKLSSLSMLSAGVAHEINNPLSSIMTHVQNLMFDEQDEEKQVSLKWIEQETRRIAGTVNQLLRFAGPDVDPGAGCDVNGVVSEAVALVGYSLHQDGKVAIGQELAPGLPAANIGANELKQVMINLVMNSLQALEGGGSVTVRTKKRRSGRIAVSVADTGRGIDGEALPHIFDPFFTTKTNGTGLGLSIVYGILKKYQADIRVSSRPERGTRMTVSLAAVHGEGMTQGRNHHGSKQH